MKAQNTVTKSDLSTDHNSQDRSKQMTQLELAFIVFILKKLSSKEKPLSAAKIAEYISWLTNDEHSEKTILRKLKMLSSIQQNPDETLVNNTLWLTFGGNIVEVSNENKKNITKKQSQFYFNPLLNESDLSLVCGAITSNRYLSASEKEYLLAREMTLTSSATDEDTLIKEIDKQCTTSQTESYHTNTNKKDVYRHYTLLRHVNQLYDAIENGYMIELIYGVYDLEHESRKLCFHPRNAKKPYRLNPYAFVWNSGAFYLLATHNGHENPVHFRVDRIIDIKPLCTEEDATQYVPRAALPSMLKPFIQLHKNNSYEFLAEKYTATYPLMGIYDDTDYRDCYIECTAATLSILIDTFGTNLRIYPSPMPHSIDEVDFHGKPQEFLAVGIKQVQYDNLLQFCLQQHSSITALYPPKLVEDVRTSLASAINKYDRVLHTPLTLQDFGKK